MPACIIFINSHTKFQFHLTRNAHKRQQRRSGSVIVRVCVFRVKYVCIINAHFTLKCTGTHAHTGEHALAHALAHSTHTDRPRGRKWRRLCDAFSAICFEPRFVFNCCMANSICMCALFVCLCWCDCECNARLEVGNACGFVRYRL